MEQVISIPNAARTFEALRNLGYDLYAAIADVVDNAITDQVHAETVKVTLQIDENSIAKCRIQDNGSGMNDRELQEAMRLGADSTYEDNDLGKFGMGMKTASLSQCDVLTVLSQKHGNEISGYRWDIIQIRKTGDWILLKLSKEEIDAILTSEEIDIGSHGTVVMWDRLSGIESDYRSYTSRKLAENYFYRLIDHLTLHLGITYHRFLEGDFKGGRKLNLLVNNQAVEPWDPFCRTEINTEKIDLKPEEREIWIDGYPKPVTIEAYILPNKEGFSSEEAWRKAKGLLSWNDAQGYYIYRANRLIRYGGWHGTKSRDEHDKLARLSIDIDPSLDDQFRITVNKARVQFPEKLYYHLKNSVNNKVVKKAKTKYNKSGETLAIKNNFRKQEEGVREVSRNLVSGNGITTAAGEEPETYVKVNNPNGYWLSNTLQDFIETGKADDFEIVSEHLTENVVWKIVCGKGDKFKVIVNASHPFYQLTYNSTTNKSVTTAIDALIFSLAFAELYNKNDENAQLFDTFKEVNSKVLKQLIDKKLV